MLLCSALLWILCEFDIRCSTSEPTINIVLFLWVQMMLYGAIFGCLSPVLSVSAVLSYKSPFVYPKDEVFYQCFDKYLHCQTIYVWFWIKCCVYLQRQNVERAKLALLNDKLDGPGDTSDIDRQSDHLLMMTAYKRWENILNAVSMWL